MNKKLAYNILVIALSFLLSNTVIAQKKSFERNRFKNEVKKDSMDMYKCMDIIAADNVMREAMLDKLVADFNSQVPIPLKLQEGNKTEIIETPKPAAIERRVHKSKIFKYLPVNRYIVIQ